MNGTATPNNPPVVTTEDRQRGWAELEIQFADGRREFVRVHALDPAELLPLAELPPDVALREGLMKSLRADAEFVAGIGGDQQLAIMAVQALLTLGDDAGRAGVELSAAAVMAQRASSQPQTAAGMRERIGSLAASVNAFKTATQGLMQSSKIRPINPI